MLSMQEIAYGQQKNREYIYSQAQDERKQLRKERGDLYTWGRCDEDWVDYRYMQLCENCNITAW